MELLCEAKWTVTVTWAGASLSENAFVATVAKIGTMWSVANIGIEKLD